ncbi:MAG TPA: DUF1849 family protein [Patescibacteria group bacterium]|nr:DUF1849 family protein [Patescibacteria group bacterium]
MNTRFLIAFFSLGLLAAGALPALAAGATVPAAPAKADVPMATHKALYDFRMTSVQSGAGISGIQGKMYYEQDDNCDAWTTDHRFSVEYQYPERRPVENTSHYVAFESKDARQFYYSSEREEDGLTIEQLRGAVKPNADGTAKANYTRPDSLSYDLPKGYLLPTQHTAEVIRHARAGDKFFTATMFDGTDADGPVEINAFIGKKLTADDKKKIAEGNPKIDAAMIAGDAWRVRMAVFPLKEDKGMSPSYEMDLILHDNGIVSWSLVDYHAFKVEQKLLALEKLPAKSCN